MNHVQTSHEMDDNYNCVYDISSIVKIIKATVKQETFSNESLLTALME